MIEHSYRAQLFDGKNTKTSITETLILRIIIKKKNTRESQGGPCFDRVGESINQIQVTRREHFTHKKRMSKDANLERAGSMVR